MKFRKLPTSRLFTVALTFSVLMLAAGCSNEEPAPEPVGEGYLLVYTKLAKVSFQKIEVYVDDELAGTITDRVDAQPDCAVESSAKVLSLKLSAGKKHKFHAKLFKAGKVESSWTDADRKVEDKTCHPLNLQ